MITASVAPVLAVCAVLGFASGAPAGMSDLDSGVAPDAGAAVDAGDSGPGEVVRLVAAGDVQLGRGIGEAVRSGGDPRAPFAAVRDVLSGADIAVANLESQLFPWCRPVASDSLRLCASPLAVEGLVDAGIDVVSVANNHALDFGPGALERSVRLLRHHGIAVAGPGLRTPVLERGGTHLAFVAFSPVDRILLPREMALAVAEARRRADLVVALVHWGEEYRERPSARQRRLAGFLAREGVDLIVGSHPHVVQPLEREQEALVFYSLGNFVFDQQWSEATSRGALAEVELRGAEIEKARLVRIRLDPPGYPRIEPER